MEQCNKRAATCIEDLFGYLKLSFYFVVFRASFPSFSSVSLKFCKENFEKFIKKKSLSYQWRQSLLVYKKL